MKRFSIVNEGYDIGEVNKFIDIVIGRLEKLNAENASHVQTIRDLTAKLNNEKSSAGHEEKLEKAVLAIQQMSDKMRDVAKEEARVIVEEARNNANSIVHEALVNAEKIEHEKMLLEKNVKVYKERVRTLIQGQLDLIEDLDKTDAKK